MIDTVALREKVLDLAIRGKLVPQDPNDEPASVLLERIREQKRQMVREGKLKAKDIKDDSIIYVGEDNLHYEKFADGTEKCIEDEIPFELPQGWAWCRFRVFCPYGECEKYETLEISDDDWILDLEDIEKHTGRILAFVTKAERNSLSTKHKFYKGQVLYSKLRPYLNKVVIAPKDGYCTSEIIPLKLYGKILPKYIQLFLMSDTFLSYVNLISYGVKMPRLGTDDGKKAIIAIPPLKEQERIVEKYESILPNIVNLQIYSDDLYESISKIKSKILDLAVRGKLVPQDPNDEPASVLLERIRAEKEELIKQGKIKRDKKESIIFKGEDNSYYEKYGEILPKGWVVTNLETLLSYEQPTDYIVNTTDYNDSYSTPVLTAGKSFFLGYTNETTGIYNQVPTIIFDDFTTESKYVDFPFKVKSSAMKILTANTDLILIRFAYYLMQSINIDHDNHQRYWISVFSKQEVALPPLAEQQRIIDTIDYYFDLLDSAVK